MATVKPSLLRMQFLNSLNTKKNRTVLCVLLGVAAAAIAGWYGYSWYAINNERAAQKDFAECIADYEGALSGYTKWEKVEELCAQAYEKNRSTSMAPYMLALQADACIGLTQLPKATELMQQSLALLSKSSPTYPLFATKYALMQLDSTDDETHKNGLAALEILGNSPAKANHDRAAYYLGLYYWSHDDVAKAREVWQNLIDAHKDFPKQSPWVNYAQTKLELIG